MIKKRLQSLEASGEYLIPQIKVINLRIRTNVMVNSPIEGPNSNEDVVNEGGEW